MSARGTLSATIVQPSYAAAVVSLLFGILKMASQHSSEVLDVVRLAKCLKQ